MPKYNDFDLDVQTIKVTAIIRHMSMEPNCSTPVHATLDNRCIAPISTKPACDIESSVRPTTIL